MNGAAHQLPIRDEFILRTYLLTGLRPGELRFLRWEDWDQSRKILKINMSKTKARHTGGAGYSRSDGYPHTPSCVEKGNK